MHALQPGEVEQCHSFFRVVPTIIAPRALQDYILILYCALDVSVPLFVFYSLRVTAEFGFLHLEY